MCTDVNSMLIDRPFSAASCPVWICVDNRIPFTHILHTAVSPYTAVYMVFHMVMHMSTPNISVSILL